MSASISLDVNCTQDTGDVSRSATESMPVDIHPSPPDANLGPRSIIGDGITATGTLAYRNDSSHGGSGQLIPPPSPRTFLDTKSTSQTRRIRLVVSFSRRDPSVSISHHVPCNPDNKPLPHVEDHLKSNTRSCPFHFVCKRDPTVIPSRWWEAELIGSHGCAFSPGGSGCCQPSTVAQLQLRSKRVAVNKSSSDEVSGAFPLRYRAQYVKIRVGFVCLSRCA